jgi:hypothetical protein
VSQIVVGDDENAAVHQAAEFLAGDIEKISIAVFSTMTKTFCRGLSTPTGVPCRRATSRWIGTSGLRFFSVDVALGLQVAQRQMQAALKLEEALRAPDAGRMWQLVFDARGSLEQLETELLRGEYPPFDRWYHETWIRSALSQSNPHRPYNQLRAFISSEGHGQLVRARRP